MMHPSDGVPLATHASLRFPSLPNPTFYAGSAAAAPARGLLSHHGLGGWACGAPLPPPVPRSQPTAVRRRQL